MAAAKPAKAVTLAVKPKPAAAAKAKAIAATKAKQAKLARQGAAVRLSLAETIHLPYRPTSFKVGDMRRVVAEVKRAQG